MHHTSEDHTRDWMNVMCAIEIWYDCEFDINFDILNSDGTISSSSVVGFHCEIWIQWNRMYHNNHGIDVDDDDNENDDDQKNIRLSNKLEMIESFITSNAISNGFRSESTKKK